MRSTKSPSWTEHPLPGWLARLAGLGPLPVPPQVFALERRRLRYAGFAREGDEVRLLEYRERELPADLFAEGRLGGPLRDAERLRVLGDEIGALVADLSGPLREAGLVLPDAWLRLAFTEVSELPRGGPARDEVLRWKLRRLVPFRVEDLRVAGSEVEPLPGQEEPRRLLLGFALEQLLAQLEESFAAHGVRLGQISNASLALLHALRRPAVDGGGGVLEALALVDRDGHCLLFARGGEPVLHRYKADGAGAEGRGRLVVRDLRLTRSFLEENVPGAEVRQALLLAPPELEESWREWLAEGLGRPVAALGREHVRLAGDAGAGWRETAALVGAACVEVR